MPTVSVVIPTYNRAHCVAEAVQSVLRQTCTDFELLVIDDGSTDRTEEVLQPFMPRIRYMRQDNAGVSAARNRGIRESRGRYVAFLDSDDEWFPDKLRVQMEAMQADPRLVAHTVNARVADEVGRDDTSFSRCGFPRGSAACGIVERPLSSQLKHSSLAMVQTVLCRREAAVAAGLFDEDLSICEDQDFLCRLALQGPWGYTWDVHAGIYRRNEQVVNLSSARYSEPARLYASLSKVCCRLLQHPAVSPAERELVLAVLRNALHGQGMALLRAGRFPEARNCLREACRIRWTPRSAVAGLLTWVPQLLLRQLIRPATAREPVRADGPAPRPLQQVEH